MKNFLKIRDGYYHIFFCGFHLCIVNRKQHPFVFKSKHLKEIVLFGYAAVKQKNKWYLWSATQIREGFVTIHDLSGFMRSHERVINENIVFFPNKNSESFDRETFDKIS